jgi:hypothetical protein
MVRRLGQVQDQRLDGRRRPPEPDSAVWMPLPRCSPGERSLRPGRFAVRRGVGVNGR